MESTRTKVVEILRRGESTIDELTQVLDLAPATVRRHLDILQRDGFVGVRPGPREPGRPHYVFSLTDLAEDLLPHHYMRLTSRLIEAMASLEPGDTAGRSGRDVAALLSERLRARPTRRGRGSRRHPSACFPLNKGSRAHVGLSF